MKHLSMSVDLTHAWRQTQGHPLSDSRAHACFLEQNELFAVACEVPGNKLLASHLLSMSPFSLYHPSGLQLVLRIGQALSYIVGQLLLPGRPSPFVLLRGPA